MCDPVSFLASPELSPPYNTPCISHTIEKGIISASPHCYSKYTFVPHRFLLYRLYISLAASSRVARYWGFMLLSPGTNNLLERKYATYGAA